MNITDIMFTLLEYLKAHPIEIINIIINFLVAVGTILLACLAYREIKHLKHKNKPKINIGINKGEISPNIIIENIGKNAIEGEVYLFIEPQNSKSIETAEIFKTKNDLFSKYFVACFDFELASDELINYRYPYEKHLNKFNSKQDISHFSRLEVKYSSKIFVNENYKSIKKYHLLPYDDWDNEKFYWEIHSINYNVKIANRINEKEENDLFNKYLEL